MTSFRHHLIALLTIPHPNDLTWGREHNASVSRAVTGSHRHPILSAALALADYADHYRALHGDSLIGQDSVLGSYWLLTASNLIKLMNGPLGRVDAGTVDRALRQLALAVGFSEQEADEL